jgi:uncharacterized membrane protein
MKQNLSTYKIILWILFGFAVLNTANTIIKSIIYGYFHYGLSDGFLEIHFNYYVPAFSFIITFIFSFLVITFLNQKLKIWQSESSKFPAIWFLILVIIGFTIEPFILIISDQKIKVLFEDLSKSEYLGKLNFDTIFNCIDYSVFGSKGLLFILILSYSIFMLKKEKKDA